MAETKTLLDVLKEQNPVCFEEWDGWDYRVFSPLSLDDVSVVSIILINEDKTQLRFELNIGRV